MSLQQVPANSSSPVSSTPQRIVMIDSLRGYALMGLFLVHMIEYYELYWYNPVDSVYKDVVFAFFAGKAYAMFALLFGVSFSILFNRKKQAIHFHKLISWRFTLLLLAGLIHGLIYGGDILQILAIAGFLLLLLYRLPGTLLFILSAFLLLQVPSMLYAANYISQTKSHYPQPFHYALFGEVYEVYAKGNFIELIKINLMKGPMAKWAFMFESGRFSSILGMTLLGYWMGKTDFFNDQKNRNKKYFICFAAATAIALFLYFLKAPIQATLQTQKYWMTNALYGSYLDLAFTFVSVFAFVLLYRVDRLKTALQYFAPPGRMSLTLYLAQSILFVPFFYGFGLGAYAFFGQFNSLVLGLFFCIMQWWFASQWLKKYHYGPLEWLWRSATYLKKDIPLKK